MNRICQGAALGTLLAGALLCAGCGSDDTAFIPIALQSPVAVNDSYSVLGNGQLTVAAAQGVLANDSPNTAIPVVQNAPTRGTLTLNADGSFTYTPNQGQANVSDSFTYTLNNGFGSNTATVTIQIGATGFFVNNQAAAGGNGSQAAPFRTLAEAVTAANGVNGAEIVIFRGDGTSGGYNTPLALQANQGVKGFDAANPPTLTGPITLTSGNRVRDLKIVGTVGTAIDGTNGSDGTISGVTIQGCTGEGITLDNASGTWSISNSQFVSVGLNAIFQGSNAGSITWIVDSCTFTDTLNLAVGVQNTGTASSTIAVRNSTCTRSTFFFARGLGSGSMRFDIVGNSFDGQGVGVRGLDVQTDGTTQLTAVVTDNTVTGATQSGFSVGHSGTSFARMRFERNRLTGNATGGFASGGDQNSNVGYLLRNNVSDFFGFSQANSAVVQVQQLSEFTTTLGNSSPPTADPGVQDVGSVAGIP